MYKEEIEKYRGQASEFENDIPYSADIGVIHVDSEDLKMRLMPSPVQCLYALKTLLPQLIGELKQNGSEAMVVAGGVIPTQDFEALHQAGVAAVFGPGTRIPAAARTIIADLDRSLAAEEAAQEQAAQQR